MSEMGKEKRENTPPLPTYAFLRLNIATQAKIITTVESVGLVFVIDNTKLANIKMAIRHIAHTIKVSLFISSPPSQEGLLISAYTSIVKYFDAT